MVRGGSSPLERTIIAGLKPPRLARTGGPAPAGAKSGSCGRWSFGASSSARRRNVSLMASPNSCSAWAMVARRSSSPRIMSKGDASSPVTSPSSLSSRRLKNAMLNCRRSRWSASRYAAAQSLARVRAQARLPQQCVQMRDGQRFARTLPRGCRCQATVCQLGEQAADRPVARAVSIERPAHQRPALRIDLYCADFTSILKSTDIPVSTSEWTQPPLPTWPSAPQPTSSNYADGSRACLPTIENGDLSLSSENATGSQTAWPAECCEGGEKRRDCGARSWRIGRNRRWRPSSRYVI